jgi:hypothetical protein
MITVSGEILWKVVSKNLLKRPKKKPALTGLL